MDFIDTYDEKLRALEERENNIRSVVQDELDELDRERSALLEERDKAIDDYILGSDPKDLLDPLKAGALYELGYDKGRGAPGFYLFYAALTEGTYVSDFAGWWTLRNEQAPVKMPTFVLEDSYEPELLKSSLELLERLYKAASAVNSSVPIDVYGLYTNYRIKLVNESWEISKADKTAVLNGIATLEEAIQLIQARTP